MNKVKLTPTRARKLATYIRETPQKVRQHWDHVVWAHEDPDMPRGKH